jgi:glycosyltransferase involved in cell wall biosynthesis
MMIMQMNANLVVFSHLRWDFVYQRPQHLLSRLAQQGMNIIFIEEPFKTTAEPYLEEMHYNVEGSSGIKVIRPHTNLDEFGFSNNQMSVMEPMIESLLKNTDLQGPVGVWFYTPQALPLIKTYLYDIVIFDVMDELSLFANAPAELLEREAQLLKIADLVFTGGPSLWNSKIKVRPDAFCIPSSVDAKHYSPNNLDKLKVAAVEERYQKNIPKGNRIGFFGVIDERLDLELLAEVADADPHWHLIMAGPVVKIDPATLPQRKNIHYLGKQEYADLPALVSTWDVCIMPFALNDATKFISPTKTLEYLAAFRPVVSTNIYDVKFLYSEAVEIGMNHQEFIKHIRTILKEDIGEMAVRVANARQTVEKTSWDQAAEFVKNEIVGVLKLNLVV